MVKGISRRTAFLMILILAFVSFGWALADAFRTRSGDGAGNFSYPFGSFGTVHVRSPPREPQGVVLLISDSGGPDDRDAQISASLTRIGLAVVGISLAETRHKLKPRQADCISFVNSLDNLSKDVQHRMGVKTYLQPVIAGIGEGGALAYIANQQSAVGLYRATVSFGFSPQFRSDWPLCIVRTGKPSRAPNWNLLPVHSVPAPWIVVAPDPPATSKNGLSLVRFVGAVHNARLVKGVTAAEQPVPARILSGIFEPMLQTVADASPGALAGLPITEITGAGVPVTDTMAIFYSGDGGWTGLNQQITTDLAKKGVPTIGISSLEYFWTAKTPESAAQDLHKIIQAYGRRWQRSRVIIIGYSFGADVLPFIYAALPPDSQRQVVRLSLLGLGGKADFQFHLGSWLDISGDDAMPTVPAIARLTDVNVQCIRGTTERNNACPDIPTGKADQVLLPGDHHFNGNASLIAQTFLNGIQL